MSNEIKEKEEYEKYARDHRKELDAQEVRLGDVVTVLVGQFAGEKGVIVGISACLNDYSGPYYEVDMNCEVPEKYKCRKTLISPNNVIGGLSAHEFEVIGNCTPKQPSMEIKVGDKVRVSKDAPKMYLRGFDHIFTGVESVVSEVEDDNAVIIFNTGHINSQITIPTKYLVKVDAEAKEPTAPAIKVGDNVRNIITGEVGRVLDIQRHVAKVDVVCDWKDRYWDLNNIEVFVPKTEECHYIPTEAEKPNIGSIKIPVEVDLTDSYWDAYAAELAKEVVFKVANKFNAPHEAAEYAVTVAKAVVEGLKRE